MNDFIEDRSLLEVKEWKEICRKEDEGLSFKEYTEKIKTVSEQLKAEAKIQQDTASVS